jgi:hypothetical protein
MSRRCRLLVAFVYTFGCAHVAPSATFAAGMEDCFQRSETCAEYTECTHKVQAAHGQPISGSCELADGGAP